MSDEEAVANLYLLKGPEIEVTYRPGGNKLDVAGDDPMFGDDMEATCTESDIGMHITATLLEASRTGTRTMLALLLPVVIWRPGASRDPAPVTGLAIIVSSFRDAMSGGRPPALHRYDDVRRLEGSASL